VEVAAAARGGRFTFLDQGVTLGRPVAWNARPPSRLWGYQLQYSGFVVDLVATRPEGWSEAESLMSEWVSACPLGEAGDAWHPFVVSERLVNWIYAIEFGAPSADAVPDRLWRSLALQIWFVTRNLETDVGGNHLLKNLKAISIAGCVWGGRTAEAWRARFVSWFTRELARQLLADGAHYERSPMYHALVLSDALEVVYVLRLAGHPVPESLAASVEAMAAYLPHVTHPDGEIALFNDSVHGEAPPPAELLAAARSAVGDASPGVPLRHALLAAAPVAPFRRSRGAATRSTGEDGGIERVGVLDGRGVLLVDVGRACPDALPAHAHADFFSFELSLDQRRMIVDAGVGEYAEGGWREYYRSTRAHNTVAVDDTDQIECWGSFRVARRANVRDRRRIRGPLVRGVHATHDGYARLSRPVDVGRTLVAVDDRAWLVLDDIRGTGEHTWRSYLHAGPGVELTLGPTGRASLSVDDRRLAVAWFAADEVDLARGETAPRQGWHAPEFGRHLPVWTLALGGAGPLPARLGYLLAPDLDPGEIDLSDAGDVVRIRLGGTRYEVTGTAASLAVRLV